MEQHPKRNADQALKAALEEANRVVVLRRQNLSFGQMGTTVVAAMFSGREVIIGNVGDSRAYLVRGGAIQQLTTDHTFVQELVERGQILHEDAMAHPQAHVLTRCIGAEPGLKVDISKYWIWKGAHQDKLVLCSDGLYSLVSDDEIGKAISDLTPQKACVHLVELAKSRGGYDNITISVVPLGGELRDEPAPDYYEPRQSRGQRNKHMNLMLVVGLSCFAIIAVGVFILQVLSN